MHVIRTDDDKKAMVEKLEAMLPTVPETTVFGDNNHDGINAQIKAIEEEWDEDRAWDEYPDDEEDQHTRDMVLDAINWLRGDQQDDVLLDQW